MQIAALHFDLVNQYLELISDRRNLQRGSRHRPKLCFYCFSAYIYVTHVAHETGFFGGSFAGRIAMLLPSRMAGQTLGIRGPDLARGPEVARPCCRGRNCCSTYSTTHIPMNTHIHAPLTSPTISGSCGPGDRDNRKRWCSWYNEDRAYIGQVLQARLIVDVIFPGSMDSAALFEHIT